MDYAHYVSRRPPSPPLFMSKLKSFPATPSLASASPAPPSPNAPYFSKAPNPSTFAPPLHLNFPDDPLSHQPHQNPPPNKILPSSPPRTSFPQTPNTNINNNVNNNNNNNNNNRHQQQIPTLDHANTTPNTDPSTSVNISASVRSTSTVSAQLHRRRLRDEYVSLVRVVGAARDTEANRDRQEAKRLRLEDMLTRADSRTAHVLHAELAKCNAKVDALVAATRHVDDARTRMRVFETSFFIGSKSAIVPPEIRALHIRRGSLATLVEHIQCTLYDMVRIHFLLSQISDKLSHMRSLLATMDRCVNGNDCSKNNGERERGDNLSLVSPNPVIPQHQQHVHHHHHHHYHHPQHQQNVNSTYPFTSSLTSYSPMFSDRRDAPDLYTHATTTLNGAGNGRGYHPGAGRTSFSADTIRRATFNRRVSKSHAFRHHSQDGTYAQNSSMSYTPSPTSLSSNSPRAENSRPNRSHPRRSDGGIIPYVVKRALSYNSTANSSVNTNNNLNPSNINLHHDNNSLNHNHSNHTNNSNNINNTTNHSNVHQQSSSTDEPSWWALNKSKNNRNIQSSPHTPATPPRADGPRFSFGSVLRGDGLSGSGSISGSAGRPWRRRSARLVDDDVMVTPNGDDHLLEQDHDHDAQSFPVSPVSYSTASDHPLPHPYTGYSGSATAVDTDISCESRAILQDVDSLCTDASSVLSSSKGFSPLMDDPLSNRKFNPHATFSSVPTARQTSPQRHFHHPLGNNSGMPSPSRRPGHGRRRGSLSSTGRNGGGGNAASASWGSPNHQNDGLNQDHLDSSVHGGMNSFSTPAPPVTTSMSMSSTSASKGGTSSLNIGSTSTKSNNSFNMSSYTTSNHSGSAKTRRKLGLGRLRVQGQMKRLWAEINEMFVVVLTHGPHLMEEKIVPRMCIETGLLGSWNAGKGQGASLRLGVQMDIVGEATRKVEGIVTWQQQLVVAIRRDLFEQKMALRSADHMLSKEYMSSVIEGGADEKG